MLRAREAGHAASLRGFLLRGCQPKLVILDTEDASTTMQLLRPFMEVSASRFGPLPTAELRVPAASMAGVAEAVAQAFPNLRRLSLKAAERLDLHAARDIQQMLGSGTNSVALLPSLKELSLTRATNNDATAPPAPQREATFTACVGGATQLTSLNVGFSVRPADLSALGTITSLQSLQLRACSDDTLARFQEVEKLQALTALNLGMTRGLLPKSHLTALRSLADLHVPLASLDVSALQGLSSLTRLSLGELVETPGLAPPGATAWQLPPLLADLSLHQQRPRVLCGLRPSTSRALTQSYVQLTLIPDLDVGRNDSCLQLAGEEALCGAAEALAGRLGGNARLSIHAICTEPLKPVGGEAGPGRRNHTRWLRALARTGARSLDLWGVALSHQDMSTIAEEWADLESLVLQYNCFFAASALPRLARLPLRLLGLDLSGWRGPGQRGPMRIPFGAEGSLLALLSSPGFTGSVRLWCPGRLQAGDSLARVDGMVEAIRAELEAMQLDPSRIELRC